MTDWLWFLSHELPYLKSLGRRTEWWNRQSPLKKMPVMPKCIIENVIKACLPTGPQCNRPIGMENRRIRNQQISASSEWDVNHGARLARLNQKRTGRTMGAWSARVNNAYQFLQIDLRVPMKVTSVATQGRSDANQWVTKYMLSFSLDGAHFAVYWSQGRPWVCC